MMNINIGAGALAMGSMGSASAQGIATKPTIHNSTHTLTGCLQKGDDEYVLTSDDGVIWELTGDRVKLDGQIGHTVAITGLVSDPAVHGTKVNMEGEMKGHGGYGYIRVMKLTLVSNSCERNS